MKNKRLFLFAAMAAFAVQASAQITMTVDATRRGPLVSPYQYGLFFEEINHAGDGGLYAELVRNRSFEEELDGWTAVGGAELSLTTTSLLNDAQGHALSVNVASASDTDMKGIANSGFWGMSIQKDSVYTLSLWVKAPKSFTGRIKAQLRAADGQAVIGQSELEGSTAATKWSRLTATIKATGTDHAGQLVLLTGNNGRLNIDMVSLFPGTWRNRANGLRPDLAQLLADTRPTFLRFPGGCYVEGEGSYDNAFQWKKTIGPIEERPGHMNQNWRYRSSDGLGYDEYLQLAEDMGAAPMFVVNIGLGHGFTLSLEETETLVQDCLDAIEYANGDASTEWGARRIANGHAEPYNLKFIEVGNENYQAGDIGYVERYYMFYKAIKEKYPEIVVIGNVEAWGTDTPSWRNKYPVDLVDEHYYRSYTWMRDNYNKYDNTPRSIGIYNGEYAANAGGTYGTYGNMNSALGEAVYMLGMERNSDVCRMASFAPIFTHEMDPRWAYDMIHFRQGANFVTPSYHVQKILGNSLGHQNMLWTETGNTVSSSVAEARVGVGAWSTQVVYDDVTVTLPDGTVVAQDDFTTDSGKWSFNTGTWDVTGGNLTQTQQAENCTAVLNIPVAGGSYTYKLRAKKISGWEGFLIMFDYQDSNNYIWWNIGGWTNSKHGVEKCENGSKTTVASASGSIETGRWYDIEIRKEGSMVTCLLDGQEVHKFTLASQRAIYQSLQMTADGSAMLLKVVNPHGTARRLTVDGRNMTLLGVRTEYSLKAESGLAENTMDAPFNVAPDVTPDAPSAETPATDGKIVVDVPAYSLTVYRIAIAGAAPEAAEDNAYTREDEGMYGYLYAHMHTTQEITCYALSSNGTYWRDLFDSREVFPTKNYTETGGMRDAYICRTQTGNFLLAGTDMTSRLGWTSNHRMTFMHSNDLVHWDKYISIDLESEENMKALGLTNPADMTAAWAPQIIFDPVTGKYMAYYSVGFPDRHRIYYSLLNEDLTEVSKPMVLFDPGYDVIDADIVWNEAEGQYVMVFKREGDRALSRATAPYLVPTGDKTTGACQWVRDPDFGIDESGQSIEAPSQFRYIGSKRWQLGYQKYSNGYNYRIMDLDERGANPANRRDISGDVAPQHGSFVKLTEAEYRYLETWEQVVTLLDKVRPIHEVLPTDESRTAIEKAEKALADDLGSFAANAAAMQEALTALEKSLEKTPNINEYLLEQARQGKPTDLTPLIVNADFANAATGWTTSPGFTAANGYVAEYYNTNFDFSQTITGLPDGSYEVTVQGFYRMGGIDAAMAAHNGGTEELNAIFYANTVETPMLSLYDGSVSDYYTMSPYNYPDNVAGANEAFNSNGLYTNTIRLEVTGGQLTIGIRKNTHVGADWCCFDNFTLRFLGNPDAVAAVDADAVKAGGRCSNLQGVYIPEMDSYHGVYIQDGQKKIKKFD